jgi:hypothetical protein
MYASASKALHASIGRTARGACDASEVARCLHQSRKEHKRIHRQLHRRSAAAQNETQRTHPQTCEQLSEV